MKYVFRQPVSVPQMAVRSGFTLVEIMAALLILVGITASALVVMNNAVEATIEMRNRQRAFETARENLETLLTASTVSDMVEYGYSEQYPEIYWELRVEPFYEPISNKMWIRAVSSAGYRDTNDEEQTIELEQWVTGLTAAQIKQILAQQETEDKIMEELYGDKNTEIQEMTKLYLQQAGLNVSAYEDFLKRQRRTKLDYLLENGKNDGYEELLDTLDIEESEFLRDLGVNFEQLDECIAFLAENPQLMPDGSAGPKTETDPDAPSPTDTPLEDTPDCSAFDCASLTPQARGIVCSIAKCCCD